MSSDWTTEIVAVFRKELTAELRSRNGLATAALFGVVSVFTLAFAAMNNRLDGNLASGMIWVAVLFSSVIALPRVFISEEEQGTGDLLRLWARPHAVFWGKALFNLAQALLMAALLTVLFLGFTHTRVVDPVLYAEALFGGCAAIAGAVTLSGAIVARAANRAALAGAIAAPLLLPVMAMGVSAMRVALGATLVTQSGQMAAVGLLGYAVATLAIGPWLFAAVWKS